MILQFILAERELGFSFAKFKMSDQCQATEGELNFHKSALKREKSKFQRGIWNAHTLKDLGKTFHELNKLAESVVKENFGSLRERTNYYRIGEIAIIHRLSPKMSIVHPWMICLDLPMPHEVFDLLNKEILGLTRVTCGGKLSRCPSWGDSRNYHVISRFLSIIRSRKDMVSVE